MATINRFEDLEIWQLAREICKKIEPCACNLIDRRNYSLADQIRRSSGSVMDNIAEGFEREGTKEFIQFLSISKGSSGECRSQLYRVLDSKSIDQTGFDELLLLLQNQSNKIRNFIQYLSKSGFSGQKFRNR